MLLSSFSSLQKNRVDYLWQAPAAERELITESPLRQWHDLAAEHEIGYMIWLDTLREWCKKGDVSSEADIDVLIDDRGVKTLLDVAPAALEINPSHDADYIEKRTAALQYKFASMTQQPSGRTVNIYFAVNAGNHRLKQVYLRKQKCFSPSLPSRDCDPKLRNILMVGPSSLAAKLPCDVVLDTVAGVPTYVPSATDGAALVELMQGF